MKSSCYQNLNGYFGLILDALQKEDIILRKAFSKFQYDPSDETGKGINDLYEHHIQYILFKTFLEKGKYLVYMEDPYKKGRGKCDLTLYGSKPNKSLWIEIKVNGWCEDWQYRKWIESDVEKMKTLSGKEVLKYLLATSIEDEKPNVDDEWGRWFKTNLPGVIFDPNLCGHFKTLFSDGKEFRKGYYTVCLLRVR